ncbi:hypothetical protein [Jannaschia pagri]|nr:hypothetical protein [Jannaschia sp. AI_62]
MCLTSVGGPLRADGFFGERLPFFAECVGRLSAQMEFQWLMGLPDADRTEAQRAATLDILQAITPPDQRRAMLHVRISAKRAQWSLLTVAQFDTEPERSVAAERRATKLLQGCTAVLLS